MLLNSREKHLRKQKIEKKKLVPLEFTPDEGRKVVIFSDDIFEEGGAERADTAYCPSCKCFTRDCQIRVKEVKGGIIFNSHYRFCCRRFNLLEAAVATPHSAPPHTQILYKQIDYKQFQTN